MSQERLQSENNFFAIEKKERYKLKNTQKEEKKEKKEKEKEQSRAGQVGKTINITLVGQPHVIPTKLIQSIKKESKRR